MKRLCIFNYLLFFIFSSSVCLPAFAIESLPLITKEIQQKMTPDEALDRLIAGNKRFVGRKMQGIDFLNKAKLTAKGQYPAAIILSCIDSRVPPEIVFDQNVGNMFATRVAANVINKDVLGGLEFATAVAGAKVIVVMGHDSCGAVRGACENVRLGHLTQLVNKIQPAIKLAKKETGKQNCNDPHFVDLAAEKNVRMVVKEIPEKSAIVRKLIANGKLKIVGAMYHLNTGEVTFLHHH